MDEGDRTDMLYVLDAHPLIWYLENNPKLSQPAAAAMADRHAQLVVPTIALAEIWHLYNRRRSGPSLAEAQSLIDSLNNCIVRPFDKAILHRMPTGLEIHDAIIVATTLTYAAGMTGPVRLITTDGRITASGLVDVHW